jgi:hypothetical protein
LHRPLGYVSQNEEEYCHKNGIHVFDKYLSTQFDTQQMYQESHNYENPGLVRITREILGMNADQIHNAGNNNAALTMHLLIRQTGRAIYRQD